MKCFYRCRNCRKRLVLPKPLEHYKQVIRCEGCGSDNFAKDNHRHKERKTKTGNYKVCKCSAVHFPHKAGTVEGCIYKVEPLYEDVTTLKKVGKKCPF